MALVRSMTAIAFVTAAGLMAGCGGTSGDGTTLESQAKSTLDAVNALAAEVEKNPSSPEVAVHIDTITANYFDAASHPAEAKQILDTYNTRIRGKLRGEHATRMKGFIDNIQIQTGQKAGK
jgi:hypothetical protein